MFDLFKKYPVYVIDEERCICCGCCESLCPTMAISEVYDGSAAAHYHIDPDGCIGCGGCEDACPLEIISEVEQ